MSWDKEKMDALIQMLSKDQAILFLGAGLSRGSGLPDWEELIIFLCGRFDVDCNGLTGMQSYDSDKGEKLQVLATQIESKALAQNQTIELEIKRKFFEYTSLDTTVQEKILETFVGQGGVVFTSNYDDLIEQAAIKKNLKTQVYAYPNILRTIQTGLNRILSDKEYYNILHIFKIHGTILDSSPELVLSTKSYETAYSNENLSLITLLADRDIIFIGCSLTDHSFGTQYRQYAGTGKWMAFYAQTDILAPIENKIIKDYNIDAISYQVRDLKDNDAHKECLMSCFDHIYAHFGYRHRKMIKTFADIDAVRRNQQITAVTISPELSSDEMHFEGIAHLKTVTFSGDYVGSRIPANAFKNCTLLGSIDLPKSITHICVSAFENCTSLKQLSACMHHDCNHKLSRISVIQERAFYGCAEMGGIFIFDESCSFDCLPDSVFGNCYNLQSIELHTALTSIGAACFRGCTNLKSINLNKLFRLKRIKKEAFLECKALKFVEFPIEFEEIGSGAFQGCTGLCAVFLSQETKTIGDFCFYECRNLSYLNNFDVCKIEEIANHAFGRCEKLKSIRFPTNLLEIKRDAFISCRNLSDVDFSNCNAIQHIDANAFQNCPLSDESKQRIAAVQSSTKASS